MRLPILVINSNLHCTVSKLWPIIGQIFDSDKRVLQFNVPAGGDSLRISG